MAIRARVVIPPMTQLNTPYPAAPQLVGWLRHRGHQAVSYDAALDLALRLYSDAGLARIFAAVATHGVPAGYAEVAANAARYRRVIGPVIAFLQGRDPSLAGRIVRQTFLPQGPRFAGVDGEEEAAAFGAHGLGDHARWLATLMIQDLADLLRLSVSPRFGLTSYGAQVAASATSYDPLAAYLDEPPDPVEALMLEGVGAAIPEDAQLVALTCPFPGNLPAALRIGQWLRRERPGARIALGGGYPSTELRELADPRIFDVVDHVVLDDGEGPLDAICADIESGAAQLVRSFVRDDDAVVFRNHPAEEPRHGALPAPSYAGLELGRYLDLLDTWNPMHRLWNEGRWLKLTAAHGCYWQRCTFCDISLPYIADYQPQRAAELADRMDALHAETGYAGFHFTDEAAPPKLLLGLALELLRRGRSYHWWGNIRFDAYFTPDRCRLLAAAGMVGVSGGIEVADDAVLAVIDKGVSIPQVARVTGAFARAGILVHGYLMYGFPGQTAQQTVDALEVVRQLMAAGCLASGFWHRFTATAHSPVGREPDRFGVEITGPARGGFAWNNLEHAEPGGIDHDAWGPGLAAAMAGWLRGEGLDAPLATWFEHPIDQPSVAHDLIGRCLAADAPDPSGKERAVWLGEAPRVAGELLQVPDEAGELLELPLGARAEVWADRLARCLPGGWQDGPPTLGELAVDELLGSFRKAGLVLV